jgi:hypothetical protein
MITKTAIDSAAKSYWKLLWGDYGQQLTRDIPRRIKAALVTNKKLASIDDVGVVIPTAHIKSTEGLLVEGMYRNASTKLMFLATLDEDLNVKEIKSFDLR